MANFTDILRLLLQEEGENPDTWGLVFNEQATKLIEQAVAGFADIITIGGTTVLTTNNGASDEARCAILRVAGVLASNAVIQVPERSKVYVIFNDTTQTDAETLSITTSAGTSYVVPNGEARLVFTDGVDFFSITADPPAGSIDADTLVGVAGALYARLDTAQIFTKSQSVRETVEAGVTGSYATNANLGNVFVLNMIGAVLLDNPSNPHSGQTINWIFKHGAAASIITFGAKFQYIGAGASPSLNSAIGTIDAVTAVYIEADDTWYYTAARGS